jgi:hypothetical protein
MQKHEHYEELCALAASGQLNEQEEQDLAEHTQNCGECRGACEDFSELLRELPPVEEAVDLVALRQAEEAEYRKRFLRRARSDGRRFSPEAERGRMPHWSRWRLLRLGLFSQWAAVAAAFLLVASGLAYRKLRNSHSLSPSPLAVASLHAAHSVASSTGATAPSGESESLLAELRSAIAASEKKIELLGIENSELRKRLELANQSVTATESDKEQIKAQLAKASVLNAELQNETKQDTQLLAQARSDLEKTSEQRTNARADLETERRDAGELASRLKTQTESLDRERELLTAGRDITDLMGARSLHVVDVYDGDGTGKNRKSFGRVFYTEGKSLIFYAFDLDERKVVNAKYSYKAWGERQSNPSSVKSLGILYVDDKSQRRWVLKVSDPEQLAEIDSVFVTLEPHDNADKPHGQKLLFAFLGSSANHP